MKDPKTCTSKWRPNQDLTRWTCWCKKDVCCAKKPISKLSLGEKKNRTDCWCKKHCAWQKKKGVQYTMKKVGKSKQLALEKVHSKCEKVRPTGSMTPYLTMCDKVLSYREADSWGGEYKPSDKYVFQWMKEYSTQDYIKEWEW